MKRAKHVPQRSCVGCRSVRAKAELLRIVRTPLGEVRVDGSGKLGGRGAYLCRNERCVEQAMKQKRLARALGVPIGEELIEDVKGWLAEAEKRKAQSDRATDS